MKDWVKNLDRPMKEWVKNNRQTNEGMGKNKQIDQ